MTSQAPQLPVSSLSEQPLYRCVAEHLRGLVEHGSLRPGDRLPSVRRLSQQRSVSITTVLEAYRLLESEGVVEARPQSGYYVRLRPCSPSDHCLEPDTTRPAPDPTQVSMEDLAMMLLRDASRPDMVQLGAAIPGGDTLPLERLHRTMAAIAREQPETCMEYSIPPGSRELRAQVARRLVEGGCGLSEDELVITSGCQEAVTLALRAVCRPGDTVAIESPNYYGILQSIQALGLRALELPTHPQDGIDLGALRYALGQHPIRACLVSNYNNPLGCSMPESHRRELVELLGSREIPLIEDDINGDLCFEGPRPRLAKSWDTRGLVLLCSSFSKTLAPGYRVGWVAPGRFQAEVEHLKYVSSLATATLPQLAVARFLANGGYDHHLRRVRRIYQERVALVSATVSRHFPPGTRITRPQGGFVVWVEMPERVEAVRIYQQAREGGITLAPGPIFSATGAYRNFLRLCCARWSPEVEQAVVRLGAWVHQAGAAA